MADHLNHKILSAFEQTSKDKPWVVLIHGLFGSLDNLNHLAKSLLSEVNCLLIDLPNHGASKPLEVFTFDAICQQIDTLLSHLNIRSAAFIGHSLGGKIAMHMSLCFPQRCSLVITADIAPVEYPHRHQTVFRGLQNIDLTSITNRRDALNQLSQYVKDTPTQNFLLKGLYHSDDRWAWRFNVKNIIENYDKIRGWHETKKTFTGPVLFIIGGNSDYVIAEYQQAIKKQFPMAAAKIIQGAGHWLHAEKPQIFNRIVSQFIRGSVEPNTLRIST